MRLVIAMAVATAIASAPAYGQAGAQAAAQAGGGTTGVPGSGGPPAAPSPAEANPGPVFVDAVEFLHRVYFREETLKSFMLQSVPGELDRATVEADAERIADRYRDRGFLKAKVKAAVLPSTAPQHVKVVIAIDAGERAELKRVKVVGNVDVDEAVLKEGFFSRPPEPLGFLTRAGFFHRPFLDQDGQRLVANYYKHGYLEARVLDTWVYANPTLDGLDVTLHVYEGPVYELGAVHFSGDVPKGVDEKIMRSRIAIADGDVCDLVSIQQQADALLDPLREAGHPFARFEQSVQVVPPPSGNPNHRAVALTLRFVAGPKPVVRKVLIAGNKGTQDRVIRRDIAVKPGQPYDFKAVKKTEHDLMLTGFFSAVQARPIPTEDPNVIDVEVDVTEQQTWLASIAPAYDATPGGEGLIWVAILADRNLLGTGIYASVFGRLSGLKQTFDLTVSEPRLLDTHVLLSAGLHRREISYLAYRVRSEVGGDVHTSIPVTDSLWVGGGLGVEYGGVVLYEKSRHDPFTGPQLDLAANKDLLPANVFRNPVSVSASWDRRDNLLAPRNGAYAAASLTYAGGLTLSGVDFLDSGAQVKLFWTPIFNITLKSNTDLGFVFNPTGGQVPVTDRYFLGGLGSVRGYPVLSLSPQETVGLTAPVGTETVAQICGVTSTDARTCTIDVGGIARLVQNVEVEFPLWPGTPFRGFLFFDAGNAFDDADLGNIGQGKPIARNTAKRPLPLNLYYSTGFGFLIETPVLPFRFEWSVPLTPRPGIDQPISFFLGIGSAF